jgi:hypothetical protein
MREFVESEFRRRQFRQCPVGQHLDGLPSGSVRPATNEGPANSSYGVRRTSGPHRGERQAGSPGSCHPELAAEVAEQVPLTLEPSAHQR